MFLRGDHDPALADSIGPLWEVVLQPGVTVRRETGPSGVAVSIKVLADTWNGADIFLATGVGYIYASDRAHDWFLSTVPRWVAFEDCLFG